MTPDTFGPTSYRLFAYYDPPTSCWRTLQGTLVSGLDEFSGTWPAAGMWDLGQAYELPMLVPPTVAAESSSLLPTPAVNDMGTGKPPEAWDAWTARMRAKHGNGNGHGSSLAIEAARLLPTPTTQDGANAGGPAQHNRHSPPLNATVMLLPTPSAADGGGGHLSRSGDRSSELLLPGVAKLIGASTPPPSAAGSESSDALFPRPFDQAGKGPNSTPS
jgi:hypothetical protein